MRPGDVPFVGALDNSNGVTAFISNSNESLDSNVLGINYNGSGVCEAFYHPYECIFSDDVKRLHLKEGGDGMFVLLFAGTMIRQQKSKYEYAYKFNEQRMRRQTVMLPASQEGAPNFDYMSSLMELLRKGLLARYRKYATRRLSELTHADIPVLGEVDWALFHVGELFDVRRPVARNKDDYEPGRVPFVASGAQNNGVMRFCTQRPGEQLDVKLCITVSPVDGSAFFQPFDFLGRGGAGSSVLMLYNDCINEYSGLFLARMISQTCSKYTYGRMGNKDGIKRETLLLPVDSEGQPDYAYMEQYVKNMMYKKYSHYLAWLHRQPVDSEAARGGQ